MVFNRLVHGAKALAIRTAPWSSLFSTRFSASLNFLYTKSYSNCPARTDEVKKRKSLTMAKQRFRRLFSMGEAAPPDKLMMIDTL
jgi:hypothetical protein